MEALLIRLLISALVVWLAQTILGALQIKEPARKALFVAVVIMVILWFVGIFV
jgi:hypothetical protein